MKNLICGAFAAALLGSAALPAIAADLPTTKAPVYAPIDDSFDPFLIRVRALGFLPNASGTTYSGWSILGSGYQNNHLGDAKLQNNVVPEVDITYFFTKHIAVEAICCTVHTRLTGKVAPLAGTQDIANTTLFPPTVTLQYHFALGQFDPYVGVGANYTWFWGTTSTLGQSLGLGNIVNIHPAAGVDFNAGFDYYLTKNWVLNADAKYLLLHTTANVSAFGSNTLSLNANTWLVGVGLGYRFGLPASILPVVAKY